MSLLTDYNLDIKTNTKQTQNKHKTKQTVQRKKGKYKMTINTITATFIGISIVTAAIGYGAFAIMRLVDRLYYEHEEKCAAKVSN